MDTVYLHNISLFYFGTKEEAVEGRRLGNDIRWTGEGWYAGRVDIKYDYTLFYSKLSKVELEEIIDKIQYNLNKLKSYYPQDHII